MLLLIALALLGPSFAGCVQTGEAGTGTGAFYVKDAPEDDWSHVNVTFTSVRVHMGDEDGGNDSGEWITVAENETGREVDLLAFSSADARALLGAAELPNGTYNQVLINVTEAYGIHKDSGEREDFTLTRPQLRLTRAWQIEENRTTHLIADLDLDRSIVQQGQGDYRFNPVIGQVIEERNNEEPRTVRGQSGQADDSDGTSTGSGSGSMTTYVKDAPTDEFDEVWIAFDQVEVHYAGNGSDENGTEANETEGNTSDTNETDGRWITTVDEPRELDLLRFNQSGSKAFLGDANVPPGKYTQIRILITDAWGVTNNGTEVNITLASSTARVIHPWDVSDNGTTAQVTIDLDLDRSLVQTGGQGGGGQGQNNASDGDRSEWRMTPVIGEVVVDHVAVDPKQDQPDSEDVVEDTTSGTSDGTSGSQENGSATAYVKDAPANFSEVWINFSEVSVHYAGPAADEDETEENGTAANGTSANGTDDNATDDGEWMTIFNGSREIDLLNFSEDGSKAFLGDAELPAGKYTQIRLNLTDAWGVENGSRVNITVTAGMAIVNKPFTIQANNTTQIVIDVDLDKSLHAQGGGSGQGGQGGQGDGGPEASWRLTPVIGSVVFDHVEQDPRQDVPDPAS